jgi:hypothetical protein
VLQTSKVDPRSLAAGIQASYAVVTFKGKTWNIRYRGNDNPLLVRDQSGTILGQVPSIDIIVIRSATPISKTFYLKEFAEGSFSPPDCWSTNGQHRSQRATPSRTTPAPAASGTPSAPAAVRLVTVINAKRCTDNKRIAIKCQPVT